MVIWKYELAIADQFEMELPEHAQIIHVAEQGKFCCMWAIVQPAAAKVKRRFAVVGTGHQFNPEYKIYTGTIVTTTGFVWHLFEIK